MTKTARKYRANFLYKRLKSVYKKLFPIYDVVYFLDRYLPEGHASIVQVGSNDGKKSDPLHALILKNTEWKIVFVEPVPQYFERLRQNYGSDPRYTFVNAAINDGTSATFYVVKPEVREHLKDLPFWIEQLSSFDRSHILKFFDGRLEPFIEEIELTGISLNTLFEENDVKDLDIIHIDTEGYDWKILKQLPLDQYSPSIILFEFVNLTDEELQESKASLDGDYFIFHFKNDYLCIRKNLFKKGDMTKIKNRLVN